MADPNQKMTSLYANFLTPTNAYRGKPFWAWNGRLEPEELIRQIHVFHAMGFGGFFMHSRTGLVTEYLGDEWFDLINLCADEAERLGMEAWIYDEDRWPSGTAGGLVTMDPRFRRKFLSLEVLEMREAPGLENALALFAGSVEGLTFSTVRRIAPADRIGPNESILKFSVVEMDSSDFYNGYTYVDTLNRDATNEFIRRTHERYLEKCGDRLGRSIKGIFTDEPHRGSVMDGFGVDNRNKAWLAPYTERIFSEFFSRFGYELLDRLPDLFLQRDGHRISQVKWHYVELLQELFLENFVQPLNTWCASHDLILTGHGLHEDSLTAQTAMTGSLMRVYEHIEYPGMDLLGEFNRAYWVAKQLSSAARQTGHQWKLSELYGCTGWQMDFFGHKAVGDWQALLGVNVRCPHLAWYTMEGEAKRDFPASIFHQSAWWQEYSSVETYFARLGIVLQQGDAEVEVLVINPVESVWCQIYPGWSKNLVAEGQAVQDLEKVYQQLFQWLIGAQIDFDYADEEMMSRLTRVERDESGVPVFWVGKAGYRIVVIAGMETIRSTTVDALKEFFRWEGMW